MVALHYSLKSVYLEGGVNRDGHLPARCASSGIPIDHSLGAAVEKHVEHSDIGKVQPYHGLATMGMGAIRTGTLEGTAGSSRMMNLSF